MGCGCNKKTNNPRGVAFKPTQFARNVNAISPTPPEINASATPMVNIPKTAPSRLDAERRRIEKIKRDLVRAKLI